MYRVTGRTFHPLFFSLISVRKLFTFKARDFDLPASDVRFSNKKLRGEAFPTLSIRLVALLTFYPRRLDSLTNTERATERMNDFEKFSSLSNGGSGMNVTFLLFVIVMCFHAYEWLQKLNINDCKMKLVTFRTSLSNFGFFPGKLSLDSEVIDAVLKRNLSHNQMKEVMD